MKAKMSKARRKSLKELYKEAETIARATPGFPSKDKILVEIPDDKSTHDSKHR